MNRSFILYTSFHTPIQGLTLEEKGELLDVIFHYQIHNCIPENTSKGVLIAFNFMRSAMDENKDRYEKRCATNRANGSLGGRPSKETQAHPQETDRLLQKPNKTELKRTKPNKTLYEYEYEYDKNKKTQKTKNLSLNNFRQGKLSATSKKMIRELPWFDKRYELPFFNWLEYKKAEKGQTYKTEQSLKGCFTKLQNCSQNNPDEAALVIDEAIANLYQGFFERDISKRKSTNSPKNTSKPSTKGKFRRE